MKISINGVTFEGAKVNSMNSTRVRVEIPIDQFRENEIGFVLGVKSGVISDFDVYESLGHAVVSLGTEYFSAEE